MTDKNLGVFLGVKDKYISEKLEQHFKNNLDGLFCCGFYICLERSNKHNWINTALDKMTYPNTKQLYKVALKKFILRPKLVTFLS